MKKSNKNRHVFPKWSNKVPLILLTGGGITVLFIIYLFWYWFSLSKTKVLPIKYLPLRLFPIHL